ncbi:TlpA family protein disulfide reductase [Sinorhizobium meliloti]|uniref:TlpA family protein disulfide reductase n=1 Tax=Rhizobium meliloti TaxID=382 RepID=UPI000FD982B3|nr:TlpA disulfide reductase family protein [Sinorhizobium meliloti]MDE3823650.1 TlpA family protein disulfide reductase [Sinorhizobium meliloti]RVH99192.1 TlpA family protein disulfide reductase [Sinorhizobium meliloti]RVK42692.1 TlpA family protein disulfide reductase [Sinorhizobium meliloti]RVM40434.1 TlpA family protein disulfide reductase [Sinorhizobium meliloti]RVM75997.1 TlpA family protein disulfide reductase [Sinorhizobium meliloti]
MSHQTPSTNDPVLQMNSLAPALEVQDWVRGKPLASFQPDRVYIVDFWATWCGPCVSAMPYLMELQEKYKDRGLEVVAVAADEKAATADEAQAHLDAWLTEKFPKLNFRIGLDCTGEMQKLWMEASFSFGIPCSFVVDRDSQIAFIGHPAELDDVLPQVLDGSWRTSDQAKAAERERIAKGREQALMDSIGDKFHAAMGMKDWKTALSVIEEGTALLPDSFQIRAAHVRLLLHKMGDMQAGLPVLWQLVRDAIDRNAEDWLLGALNQLFDPAYDYPDFPSVERLAMGKELSEHILALTGLKDDAKASYYRWVAPYYYESGDKARAGELLELALKLVDGLPVPDSTKQPWLEDLLQTLANYKGEEVSHGALGVAPKENVPNRATPKTEKKNPAERGALE